MSDRSEQRAARGLSQEEGWPLHPARRDFAAVLFAACRALGLPDDAQGRPNLRELSTRIRPHNPSLLSEAIKNPGWPELPLLIDLAEHGGVPLARSLRGLGLLSPQALADELDHTLAVPPPSPKEAEILSLLRRLTPEDRRHILALLRSLASAQS